MSQPPPPPPPGDPLPYYGGPPPAYGGPPTALPPGNDKGLGWTGFALALVVCVPCLPIVGLVIAIVALARRRFQPRWVAALTVVLGLAATGLQVAMVPPILDGIRDGVNDSIDASTEEARRSGEPSEVPTLKLRAGDCFNDPNLRRADPDEQVESGTVTLLPCTRKHDLEIYATLRVPGGKFPGQAAIERRTTECIKRFRKFVGVPYPDSQFEVYYYYPTKLSWRLFDDHAIQCAVGHPERRVTGTLRDRKR
ncbi:hypothetical protein [Pimelobacter simplex]|uniref:hypothetical protein n=1 Tax=Nocardioides simplex TaxID=2045 RepID=UPI003AAF70B7